MQLGGIAWGGRADEEMQLGGTERDGRADEETQLEARAVHALPDAASVGLDDKLLSFVDSLSFVRLGLFCDPRFFVRVPYRYLCHFHDRCCRLCHRRNWRDWTQCNNNEHC